ncbi:virulence factor TspB C-terminal domain-related protein [Acinetobacter rongchengensis]|uniref:Uncharacterized protein n=1 Tax=Acinetobacter rongchengensis TaxID=2419601 RepID=A0A3A8EV72_9GAMM|nr:virulence factor TspB C-terminal domain-related protein [Acinetobacter rongchengensis]RKG32323.1 hypothetical protein D7V20_18315 [Acinetobacter rongchengensis]
MGRFKKYIAVLLMFSVYMMPFNARAAGFNGWTLSNPVAQGASTVYNGAKNVIINGKNVAKTSTALITPVAKDVSKVLARGVAGVALSVAVEGLLGSVDWVLDPANSLIRYKEKETGKDCTVKTDCPAIPMIWSVSVGSIPKFFSDDITACKAGMSVWPELNGKISKIVYESNGKVAKCYHAYGYTQVNQVVNPAYNPNAETDNQEKSIPLDVVSQKIISNAESGNSDAKVATTAAAADIVNDAQNDDAKARPIVNQLEANAKTATDEMATGETKPNTETGGTDLSIEFPTFCGWAPQVCEAAQTVISFPTTLTNWWETGKSKAESWAQSISEAWTLAQEWVKEPEKEDTELNINDQTENEPDSTINFSTACPQKIPLTFNWNGSTLDFSFDFTIWCESISTFVYPIVVALGSLHALYIVTGVRQDV